MSNAESIPIETFDPTKARRYRKRGVTHCYACQNGAVYFPSWAGRRGQRFKGPHMVMHRIDPKTGDPVETYGCATVEFYNTYDRVGSDRWIYRKRALVRAYQVDHPFRIVARTSEGIEAAEATGDAGDWIVQNPGGDVYLWSQAAARDYELVEDVP